VTCGAGTVQHVPALAGGTAKQEQCRSQVALGRLGSPDDVADAAFFLLSSRSSYITGQESAPRAGIAALAR
jgi:NAD(P)-dependent dehydrogenase (short-subunit alcohol dehydrogenase family)